ncbi:MAG: serine/threonine protein kinase [Lentisphaeria bacterium]|nr:serine/threonine protein kinase [Lentisphaeria bacterium]
MKLFCKECEKIFSADKSDNDEIKCPLCGVAQAYPDVFPGVGCVIGDFLIEKSLSKGGMGEVFIARQVSLDRPVALKILQQEYTKDREYIDGLFREARAAAKINHPNIVQAYAVGEDEGVFYFAMELVRGDTMKAVLKREGILDFKKAAKVICDIAKALDVAWKEQKLVHQDIKPDNIMFDNSSGLAKLADLGLAKTGNTESFDDDDSDEVFGTPQYISPEQLTGVPTDVRSDIYSLGATFFQFVTGRFPYVAATSEELAHMHNAGNLEPPQKVNPKVPDELNRIILKMMARNIADRYQTPAPLIADIEAYLRTAETVVPAQKENSGNQRKSLKISLPAVKKTVQKSVPPVESAVNDEPENSTGESEKLKLKISPKVAIVLVIAVVLLIVAGGAVFVQQKYFPGAMSGLFSSISNWFSEKAESDADDKTSQSVSEEKTESPAKRVDIQEKVLPRQEYKKAVEQAMSGSFSQIDSLWHYLSEPKNTAELELFNTFVEQFARSDESQRVSQSRAGLREVFQRNRDRNIRAQNAARREAERLRREEELQRQESERIRREEERRREREKANQKRELFAHMNKCLLAFSKAASGEGQKEFDDAVEQAKFFLDGIYNPLPEAKVLAELLTSLPGKKSELQKVFKQFRSISEKSNISFSMDRERFRIAGIRPGELTCINRAGDIIVMDIFSKSNKSRFFNTLRNRMDIDDVEIFYYLFNNRIPPQSAATKSFWGRCLLLK